MRLILAVLFLVPSVAAIPVPDGIALTTRETGSFFSLCLPGQNDAGSGRDSNFSHPIAFTPGTARGCVDSLDFTDYFTTPVRAGDRIDMTARPLHCEPTQEGRLLVGGFVFWNSSTDYDFFRSEGGEPCETVRVSGTASYDGTARLRVVHWGGNGNYEVTLQVGDLPTFCGVQDDAAAGRDSTWYLPIPVSPGTLDGCVDRFDTFDRYLVPVQAGDLVHATMVSEGCGLFLFGRYWDEHSAGKSGSCDRQEMGAQMWAAGEYPVSVSRFDGESAYRIVIEVGPSLPRACTVQDDAGSGADSHPGETWNFYVRDHALAPLLPDGASGACLDLFDGWDEFGLVVGEEELVRFVARETTCAESFAFYSDYNFTTTTERFARGADGCATWSFALHGAEVAGFGPQRWREDLRFAFTVERCGPREPHPLQPKFWTGMALDACPPELS